MGHTLCQVDNEYNYRAMNLIQGEVQCVLESWISVGAIQGQVAASSVWEAFT